MSKNLAKCWSPLGYGSFLLTPPQLGRFFTVFFAFTKRESEMHTSEGKCKNVFQCKLHVKDALRWKFRKAGCIINVAFKIGTRADARCIRMKTSIVSRILILCISILGCRQAHLRIECFSSKNVSNCVNNMIASKTIELGRTQVDG